MGSALSSVMNWVIDEKSAEAIVLLGFFFQVGRAESLSKEFFFNRCTNHEEPSQTAKRSDEPCGSRRMVVGWVDVVRSRRILG